MTNSKKAPKKKNPFPDFKAADKRQVIGNLVKISSQDYKNKFFWSKEMKLFGSLFEKYQNPNFWKLLDLGFKLNSLAWLKSKDGKLEIDRRWKVFNYEPPKKEEEIILEDKVGESIIDKTRPKRQTLMEFLDG